MDTDKIITETCSNLMLEIAGQENIPFSNIGIRIDLENERSKPILSVFNKSRFIKQIFIKELAKASGVGMLSGLISSSIGNIVKSIFKYGIEQYNAAGTKEIFILLYLKDLKESVQPNTAIALYIMGQVKETKLLSEILSEAQNK